MSELSVVPAGSPDVETIRRRREDRGDDAAGASHGCSTHRARKIP